jgi:formate/nitrite transporter FocA (FNT family)
MPREIWDRSVEEGERRMERTVLGQASTAVLGAFDVLAGLIVAVTLTGAIASISNDEVGHAIGSLGFGIAFVLITIGRSELFTENFLVPVGARLAGRGSNHALARMWGLTLIFNLVGAAAVAAIFSVHGVLPPSAYHAAGQLSDTFSGRDYGQALASAIAAGAVMTVYTWLAMATKSDSARIMLAMLIGFLLLLPTLNHVIVSFCELMLGVISGASHPGLGETVAHFGVALGGNIIGGIGFVTLTRLIQVGGEPHDPEHADQS